jgi:hypothetical protein
MAAWDAVYANEKLELVKNNAAISATFAMPIPSKFTPLSNKICLEFVNARFNKDGNCKIAYCYFGSNKHFRLKVQNEWAICKDRELVSGTYDDVIIKRSLDLIVVHQYKSKWGTNQYNISHATLTEDAAYGVYEGSKFTGKYYILGSSVLGTDIPSKNAMKYKSVVKQ